MVTQRSLMLLKFVSSLFPLRKFRLSESITCALSQKYFASKRLTTDATKCFITSFKIMEPLIVINQDEQEERPCFLKQHMRKDLCHEVVDQVSQKYQQYQVTGIWFLLRGIKEIGQCYNCRSRFTCWKRSSFLLFNQPCSK